MADRASHLAWLCNSRVSLVLCQLQCQLLPLQLQEYRHLLRIGLYAWTHSRVEHNGACTHTHTHPTHPILVRWMNQSGCDNIIVMDEVCTKNSTHQQLTAARVPYPPNIHMRAHTYIGSLSSDQVKRTDQPHNTQLWCYVAGPLLLPDHL